VPRGWPSAYGRIGSDDVVYVSVWQNPELATTGPVRSDGKITADYTDTQPQRAATVAQFFVDRFLADSRAMQMRESSQACTFILGQVDLYAGQLAVAEAGLDEHARPVAMTAW